MKLLANGVRSLVLAMLTNSKTARTLGQYLAHRRSLCDHQGNGSICGGRWIKMATRLISWCNAGPINTPGSLLPRLLKRQGVEPLCLITDKIRSYDAAHRKVMPTVEHRNSVYAGNRVEGSHQPTRQQEYRMRCFSSSQQAQRLLTLHGLTQNLFRFGRHLMQAVNYCLLRTQAFQIVGE